VVAERHLPAVLAVPGVTVRAVYDPDPAAAQRVAAAAGGALVASSLGQAVRTYGVDAVAVASPNAFHREGVEAAAALGRHIFCEKPIATTLQDARAICDAAARAGVLLQIGFHHRFATEFTLARRLLEAGVIGRVHAFQSMISEPLSLVPGSGNYRLNPELSGGLSLIDFGSHRLDQLRALLGEFAEVHAVLDSIGAHRQDDNIALLTRTTGGALGTVSFHRFSRGAVSPTILIGDRGALCFSAYVVNPFHAAPVALFTEDPLPAEFRSFTRPSDWWNPPTPGWTAFYPPFENPHHAEYAAFFDAIRSGAPPSITGEDGYRALEIVLAAYQSHASGLAVRLPLDPAGDFPVPRFG